MKIKNIKALLDIIDIQKNVLVLKNNIYAKIVQVYPINFSLKSETEKRQILNQYNQFLKICSFDFQIFIKTKKENVENHINYINSINNKNEISYKYIEYILNLTNSNYIYSKEFYIVFSIKNLNNNPINEIINILNDMYLVIKENLIKCGNIVTDFSDYDDEYLIKKVSQILNERENSYENIK
ncbi:MAG: hypothetical protein E7311_03940 [Clostridiales bacterium]|nr:hypothetical protein [Clostridiales bacterium]